MKICLVLATALFLSQSLQAQIMGNANLNHYSNAIGKAATTTVALSDSTFMVEARILYNANENGYIAHFGVAHEAATVLACNEAIDKRIAQFTKALEALGITSANYYVDFVSQTKVYDYEIVSSIAHEKESGFEIKKNVIVRYTDKKLIEQLINTASKYDIYDLVKVDYLVDDLAKIKEIMFEEAVKQIKAKKSRYLALTDLKLESESQIISEEYTAYYPLEMYENYTAYGASHITASGYSYSRLEKVEARKMETHYYQPLLPADYDYTVNPLSLEPHVQFVYIIKVKYFIKKT